VRERPAAPLTLADITVSWQDRHGFTRSAKGSILARLLTRAEHLDSNADLMRLDVATGTAPSLLRGLGEIPLGQWDYAIVGVMLLAGPRVSKWSTSGLKTWT
jgi:hypothetical protein